MEALEQVGGSDKEKNPWQQARPARRKRRRSRRRRHLPFLPSHASSPVIRNVRAIPGGEWAPGNSLLKGARPGHSVARCWPLPSCYNKSPSSSPSAVKGPRSTTKRADTRSARPPSPAPETSTNGTLPTSKSWDMNA